MERRAYTEHIQRLWICFAQRTNAAMCKLSQALGLGPTSGVQTGVSTMLPKPRVDDPRFCWEGFIHPTWWLPWSSCLQPYPAQPSVKKPSQCLWLWWKALSFRNKNSKENRNYISFNILYIFVSNLRFRELNSWPWQWFYFPSPLTLHVPTPSSAPMARLWHLTAPGSHPSLATELQSQTPSGGGPHGKLSCRLVLSLS